MIKKDKEVLMNCFKDKIWPIEQLNVLLIEIQRHKHEQE